MGKSQQRDDSPLTGGEYCVSAVMGFSYRGMDPSSDVFRGIATMPEISLFISDTGLKMSC